MRAMKDSGVDWLGEVPVDWELKKVSYISSRSRIPATALEVVTAFRDGQVTLRANRRLDGFTEATHFHGYQRIKPGQVAVHRMDAFAGAIGVSDSDGMCSPVLALLDCETILNPRFLALYLREISKSGWIEALAKSVRERTSEFGWSELAAQTVAVPAFDEQIAIVSYLDQETSQIDLLISKKEQLIEKLLERRKALITQAVTKGLDPNVPMKDSGVEWLGEVPATWDVRPHWAFVREKKVPVANLYKELTLLSLTKQGVIVRDMEGGGKFPTNFEGYQRVEPGDLVLCLFDVEETPRTVGLVANSGMITSAYTIMTLRDIEPNFFEWYLIGMDNEKRFKPFYSGLRNTLPKPAFGSIRFAVPQRPEQLEIAEYLNQETVQIDALVAKARKGVELLRERRQALITQVVTGKLDVRGFAGGNS